MIKPFQTILHGDCREMMDRMRAGSVDAVVCDPPYEIGFMGKSWDRAGVAFDPETWRSVLRVLKPGGHMLVMGGARTYHRMACAVEDAGFEIRDCLMYMYGSGFPKSLNVKKSLEKSGSNGDEWEGWGTALKPAYEPIVVARKPLDRKSVVNNIVAHGTGSMNIDASRVATDDKLGGGAELDVQSDKPDGWDRPWRNDPVAQAAHAERIREGVQKAERLGRYPANVLLSHAEECVSVGDSEDDVYECVEDCPIAILDAQTSHLGSGGDLTGDEPTADGFSGIVYGNGKSRDSWQAYGDRGGASRFFYTSKVAKKERNWGVECKHTTMKPISLMRYLVRLITPPVGIVLDPFMGSGSTLIASSLEGFDSIGIEKDDDNFDEGRRRVEFWAENGPPS